MGTRRTSFRVCDRVFLFAIFLVEIEVAQRGNLCVLAACRIAIEWYRSVSPGVDKMRNARSLIRDSECEGGSGKEIDKSMGCKRRWLILPRLPLSLTSAWCAYSRNRLRNKKSFIMSHKVGCWRSLVVPLLFFANYKRSTIEIFISFFAYY